VKHVKGVHLSDGRLHRQSVDDKRLRWGDSDTSEDESEKDPWVVLGPWAPLMNECSSGIESTDWNHVPEDAVEIWMQNKNASDLSENNESEAMLDAPEKETRVESCKDEPLVKFEQRLSDERPLFLEALRKRLMQSSRIILDEEVRNAAKAAKQSFQEESRNGSTRLLEEAAKQGVKMVTRASDDSSSEAASSSTVESEGRKARGGPFEGRYHIGIEQDEGFKVRQRILGTRGKKLHNIKLSTSSGLLLRGKGSGKKEGPKQMESQEPMHLYISSDTAEHFEECKQKVEMLLENIYKSYRKFCETNGKDVVDLVPSCMEELSECDSLSE